MTGSALPHSSVTAGHLANFLGDISAEVGTHFAKMAKSEQFRGIFKNSYSAHAVLEEFRKNDSPLLKSASGISRRIPMLLACRQLSLAYIELRRFVEVVSWYPYFLEHKVEWEEFIGHPEAGIVRDASDPIRFAAHRDIAWHHSYIVARFKHPSWFKKAVAALGSQYSALSIYAHAAVPATNGSIALPFDDVTDGLLRAFQSDQRDVLSSGCLIIAATKPGSLAKLPAVERAWFDWLIGNSLAKTIRASSTGSVHRNRQRKSVGSLG